MWILAASPTPRAAEAGCRAELLLLSRVQVGVFWALLLGVDLLRMSDVLAPGLERLRSCSSAGGI